MIQTYSSFFTIDAVDTSNIYIDFKEGAGSELTAQVEIGSYTMTEIASAVASAMTNVGALVYTVTLDRSTRKYTISSTSAFTLLVSTGSHLGADLYSVLGFTGADTSSATTHTSNIAAGTEYKPQFWLQEYVDPIDFQKSISVSVNKTTSGDVEVVKFGTEKFYEFNIKLATNIDQGASGFLENDSTGVDKLRSFMQFCVKKYNLEFMPDRDDKNTFFKVLLESTASEKDGTGYKLKELYDSGLPGYYESGKLTFRLRE